VTTPDSCDLLCLDLPKAEALRAARLDPQALRAAAERAKALGDPTRLQVALALRDGGELCVCDLAWVCERSDKLVSHHARALRVAGLVESRREGKMIMYLLTLSGRALLEAVLPAAVTRSATSPSIRPPPT
jgi:ArsR family transcriptional regulator, lead/cadmium/zinc/bismuth-responsive transcriptional repressor